MSEDPPISSTDWERWKQDSSRFRPGDLITIVYQPFFEDRGIVGKIGIILKKTEKMDYIRYLYWDVLVEGKIYQVHYRNMRFAKSESQLNISE